MIRSMTGYGRASFEVGGLGFEVEIRTVNHRHLDARVRLPRPFSDREPEVQARIQARLQRGKADVSVTQASGAAQPALLEIDRAVADQYLKAAQELSAQQGVSGTLDVTSLLTLPGVARFVEPQLSSEAVSAALGGAVDSALEAVIDMRLTEGRALTRDLEGRLGRVCALADSIGARSGIVRSAVVEKLRRRSEQLLAETGLLDEARLHQEVVIAADRLDITEELVRLRSHVDQFRSILGDAGPDKPVGRRLDFLLQEMGREANTIGAKANDAPLSHDVVELKSDLERLREQVQNVE